MGRPLATTATAHAGHRNVAPLLLARLCGPAPRLPCARHHQQGGGLSRGEQRVSVSCPATKDSREGKRSDSDGGSSDVSTSSADPNQASAPPPQPWFLALLQRLRVPKQVIDFIAAWVFPPAGSRAAPLARAIWVTLGFCCVAMTRELFFPTARVAPREVLYSDFVTLLDTGRVRAARLEAGTSRLYFDVVRPPTPAPAAATPAATAAAPAALAATATVATAAATAVPAALAAAAPAAAEAAAASTSAAVGSSTAVAAAPQRQRFLKQFYIKLADKNDNVLLMRLLQAGVEYSVLRASLAASAANAFLTALALWIPLLPMIWMLRRIIDQRQGTGRAKKAVTPGANTPTTTFADVAGVDAAKQELLEVVTIMRQANASTSKLKVKMPSGVLLCGPPGTGKTLLAKAVAGEAGVPFFAVSASEFVELFVGRGAARIRELFAEARKAAPCVVFVDELDGVGSRRGSGYNDERDQTLNQLLTELDGFDGRPGVLFLAATNRIDVLDPALLRPGRISRKVVVPLPDVSGRAEIMGVHLRGVPLEEGLDLQTACSTVAAATEGFSGAELANVAEEAALLARREDRDEVSLRDLLGGAQRTRFGVNGRSGGNAFGGGVAQWLQQRLLDAAAPDKRLVKVGSGSG
ncbi:hypothetical protein HYH03_003009 [Edaphochlamys debaryana]|uniref:AAA+ ATPase domain-containing protein n=1 Tax=Edaphochlamys debaryana TaxID=47281 RepID=A0A835YDF6_9CHLO|nr:hypothetical protein HYH03_003009 [Edaphochlamys debaryana]|eukprot:KAG2498816.1 hypothetical protein HYH03_003009 [Edaphochlamys debaryana]